MLFFIADAKGGFQQYNEQTIGAVQSMPDGIRPQILTEDSPELIAWRVDSAKAESVRATIAFANTIRERVASSRHYLQAARWPIQLAAAKAIKAGHGSEFDVAIMAREARLRGLGETVEQLADKVLANSLIFASVGAAVDGIERATMDRIAACTELAGFETILPEAKAASLAEFIDIFTPIYGAEEAQERAAVFFGS